MTKNTLLSSLIVLTLASGCSKNSDDSKSKSESTAANTQSLPAQVDTKAAEKSKETNSDQNSNSQLQEVASGSATKEEKNSGTAPAAATPSASAKPVTSATPAAAALPIVAATPAVIAGSAESRNPAPTAVAVAPAVAAVVTPPAPPVTPPPPPPPPECSMKLLIQVSTFFNQVTTMNQAIKDKKISDQSFTLQVNGVVAQCRLIMRDFGAAHECTFKGSDQKEHNLNTASVKIDCDKYENYKKEKSL